MEAGAAGDGVGGDGPVSVGAESIGFGFYTWLGTEPSEGALGTSGFSWTSGKCDWRAASEVSTQLGHRRCGTTKNLVVFMMHCGPRRWKVQGVLHLESNHASSVQGLPV